MADQRAGRRRFVRGENWVVKRRQADRLRMTGDVHEL